MRRSSVDPSHPSAPGAGGAEERSAADKDHHHHHADDGDEEVYAEGSDYSGGDILISLSDLRDTKELFDEYEDDGGMEVEDFISRFGEIARRRNKGITDTDLALLFMRVDANANGSVDWGEISTFLLMSTEKEVIRQTAHDQARAFARQPVEQDDSIPEVKLLSHDGPVRRLLVPRRRVARAPSPRRGRSPSPGGGGDPSAGDSMSPDTLAEAAAAAEPDAAADDSDPSTGGATVSGKAGGVSSRQPPLPYLSSDDHTVKLWQPGSLRHVRTPHFSRAAITDVQFTPQWQNTFAVACMDSTVSFYNAESGELQKAFVGQKKSLFNTDTQSGTAGSSSVAKPLSSTTVQHYRTITRPTYTVGLNGLDEKRLHFSDRHSVAGNVETAVPLLRHFVKDVDIEGTVLFDLGWDTRRDAWNGFPTAVDVVHRPSFGSVPSLAVGLRGGGVQMYTLSKALNDERVLAPVGLDCDGFYHVHDDWITRLRYIPHLESIVTSSWDTTLQVRHADRMEDAGTILGKKTGSLFKAGDPTWNPLTHGHGRRVTTFDYHENLKLLASCAAAEREVLVWSPYIARPLGKLDSSKGHLLDLHFCQDDVHLLTLSDDMSVRLWDLRSYRCVTTLSVKKQANARSFTMDEGLPFQAVSYDDRQQAVVTAARMPLTFPVQRGEASVSPDFQGHRRPVIALSYASHFGQLISVDQTAVIVWDVVTGETVMRWELAGSTSTATIAPTATIVSASVDFHQRRLMVALSDGHVVNYNYINAHELKTCRPRGVVDPMLEAAALLSTTPGGRHAVDARATQEARKMALLHSRSGVGRAVPVSRRSQHMRRGAGVDPAQLTNCMCVAAQVKPRHVFAVVSTVEAGWASIHIDEDGGERQPQRVIYTGGPVYCCCPLPNSYIAFGIHGSVSIYSLEEVGTKAQVFTPAHVKNTVEDPLMVALFEGELEPDPQVVRDTNETDREESFGDLRELRQQTTTTFSSTRRTGGSSSHSGSRRASVVGGANVTNQAIRETHKPHPPSSGPGQSSSTDAQTTTAPADGTTATTGTDGESHPDPSEAQLQRSQVSVQGITECIAALHHGRPRAIIVSGHGDGFVRFWSTAHHTELHRFRAASVPDDAVYSMAVNNAHTLLVVGDHQGYVSVFDVSRVGMPDWADAPIESIVFMKRRFRAHTGPVTSIEYVDTESSTTPSSLAGSTVVESGAPDGRNLLDEEWLASVGRVDPEAIRRLTHDCPAIVTSSAACNVLLWTISGTLLREFGTAAPAAAPSTTTTAGQGTGADSATQDRGQLEPSSEALAAMDLVRMNTLYSFVEQYEGCSLQDVFDEFLGDGHPFRADPSDQRLAVLAALSEEERTLRGNDLHAATSAAAAVDDAGSPDASPQASPDASAYASPRSSSADDSSDLDEDDYGFGRRIRQPKPPPRRPGAPGTSKLAISHSGVYKAEQAFETLQTTAASEDVHGVMSARLAAEDAEHQRLLVAKALAEWTQTTARCFTKSTYAEPNAGRLIRKLLRTMVDGTRTMPPSIIHHGGQLFIRTQEYEDRVTASGSARASSPNNSTFAGTTSAASPTSRRGPPGGSGNTTGIGGAFGTMRQQQQQQQHGHTSRGSLGDSMRFSRSMVQRHVSEFNSSSFGVGQEETVVLDESRMGHHGMSSDRLTEAFRANKHPAKLAVPVSRERVDRPATAEDGGTRSHAPSRRKRSPTKLRLVGVASKFEVTMGTAASLRDAMQALNDMGHTVVKRPLDTRSSLLYEDEKEDDTAIRARLKAEESIAHRKRTWDFLTELVEGRVGTASSSSAAAGTPRHGTGGGLATSRSGSKPATAASARAAAAVHPDPKMFRAARAQLADDVGGFESAFMAGTVPPQSAVIAVTGTVPRPPRGHPQAHGTAGSASAVSSRGGIPMMPPDSRSGVATAATTTAGGMSGTTSPKPVTYADLSGLVSPSSLGTSTGGMAGSRAAFTNRHRKETRARRQLEKDAAGTDPVSRALQVALDERDEALAELQQTARQIMRSRGVADVTTAVLSSSVQQQSGGGGGGRRRRSSTVVPHPPTQAAARRLSGAGSGAPASSDNSAGPGRGRLDSETLPMMSTDEAVRQMLGGSQRSDRSGASPEDDTDHDLVYMPTAVLAGMGSSPRRPPPAPVPEATSPLTAGGTRAAAAAAAFAAKPQPKPATHGVAHGQAGGCAAASSPPPLAPPTVRRRPRDQPEQSSSLSMSVSTVRQPTSALSPAEAKDFVDGLVDGLNSELTGLHRTTSAAAPDQMLSAARGAGGAGRGGKQQQQQQQPSSAAAQTRQASTASPSGASGGRSNVVFTGRGATPDFGKIDPEEAARERRREQRRLKNQLRQQQEEAERRKAVATSKAQQLAAGLASTARGGVGVGFVFGESAADGASNPLTGDGNDVEPTSATTSFATSGGLAQQPDLVAVESHSDQDDDSDDAVDDGDLSDHDVDDPWLCGDDSDLDESQLAKMTVAARRARAARRRREKREKESGGSGGGVSIPRGASLAKLRAVMALDPGSLARSRSIAGDDVAAGQSAGNAAPTSTTVGSRSMADVVVDRLVRTIQAATSSPVASPRRGGGGSDPHGAASTPRANRGGGMSASSPMVRRIIDNADTLRTELSANLRDLTDKRGTAGLGDSDETNSLVSEEERHAAKLAEQLAIQAAAAERERREAGGVRHKTHDAVWMAQTHSRLELKPLDDLDELSGAKSKHEWLRTKRITVAERSAQIHGRQIGPAAAVGAPRTARTLGGNVGAHARHATEAKRGAFARSGNNGASPTSRQPPASARGPGR